MGTGNSNADAAAGQRGGGEYVVVARRYRPQVFDELVGQEHVARALSNAIATGRVGHAYLFTGARGVGKTSAARILAKSLNCVTGPTSTPCNRCDVCQAVSAGDDVDVLEIDGASNRGIDEIRQLRQNVNVRPSRSRFKIYIIDEVHMLTREAFNALLKTLEEPPEHVKFIFCTTEVAKIPITILSRCQRFDFAGISSGSIVRRLEQIVAAEGVEADPEALATLARRANGSMRDSQSLLEQLLAFATGKITLADVHTMLGTADDEVLARLLAALLDRDAAAALDLLDRALGESVDPAQLLEQFLGTLRDCMVAAAGGPPESFLYTPAGHSATVAESARQLGLPTILAAMQIVDQALSRLRFSTQARIVAELALVRISQLADLEDLAVVVSQLRGGAVSAAIPAAAGPVAPPRAVPTAGPPVPGRGSVGGSVAPADAAGKKNAPAAVAELAPAAESPPPAQMPPAGASPVAALPLTAATAADIWSQALSRMSGMAAAYARECEEVTAGGPTHLVVRFPASFSVARSICQRPDQLARFEQAVAEVVGQHVRVEFALAEESPAAPSADVEAPRLVSPHQRMLEITQHPLVRRATELFGAQPIRIDEPAAGREDPGRA